MTKTVTLPHSLSRTLLAEGSSPDVVVPQLRADFASRVDLTWDEASVMGVDGDADAWDVRVSRLRVSQSARSAVVVGILRRTDGGSHFDGRVRPGRLVSAWTAVLVGLAVVIGLFAARFLLPGAAREGSWVLWYVLIQIYAAIVGMVARMVYRDLAEVSLDLEESFRRELWARF